MHHFLHDHRMSSLQQSNRGLFSDVNNQSMTTEALHAPFREPTKTAKSRPISVNTKRIEFIKLGMSHTDQKLGSTQQIPRSNTMRAIREPKKRPQTSQGIQQPKRHKMVPSVRALSQTGSFKKKTTNQLLGDVQSL